MSDFDINVFTDVDYKPPSRRDIVFRSNLFGLVNIVSQKFVYKGLPDTIPQYEIEMRLLFAGYAIVVDAKAANSSMISNGLVASWGSIYGVDIYGHPNQYTAMQAGFKTSVQGFIGISGAVIYGSTSDIFKPYETSTKFMMLRKTANMLTDIDLSITASLINNRSMNAVVAKDTNTHQALEDYYCGLINGELHVPFANTGVMPFIEDLHKNNNNHEISVLELWELRQKTLKDFFNSNGIRVVSDKRERMITSEIDSDNDFLEASTRDELEARKRGIEMLNEVFGYNAEVEVNNYVSNDMAQSRANGSGD